jgi:hypothetical protein
MKYFTTALDTRTMPKLKSKYLFQEMMTFLESWKLAFGNRCWLSLVFFFFSITFLRTRNLSFPHSHVSHINAPLCALFSSVITPSFQTLLNAPIKYWNSNTVLNNTPINATQTSCWQNISIESLQHKH